MTSSADWPQVDPMPSMVSSSDLFDGDILGDELIDIYNAAVVGGSDDDDAIHEIPSLLTSAVDDKDNEPSTLDGTLSADDGLGAFRPSTSFNDLTGLLSEPATAPAPEASNQTAQGIATHAAAPVPSASAVAADAEAASKKRPATVASAPVAKRRVSNSGVRKGPNSPAQASKNTPNPLTLASLPVGKSIIKAPVVVKSAVAAGASLAPAVISPRLQQQQPVHQPIAAAPTQRVAAAPAQPAATVTTEADFKSVAQAAVSNLIMNAGSKTSDSTSLRVTAPAPKDCGVRVDTSTEHIKALTGSNWVAVCAPPDGAQTPSATDKNAAANNANNRARRQNLTPDERARQNRDRNREHARNTRLRKKAYVEELKRTLTELVAQRDTSELERRHAAQRELEQREVRFRVMEEFLKLRGRNEPHSARWAAILEDNFAFTLPVTDFRTMVHEQASPIMEQTLTGVNEAMSDSTKLSVFLQTIHGKGLTSGPHQVSLVYHCERANFFMDNCNAVLEWTATSEGAIRQGTTAELALKGTLRAKFSPASNKLISASMAFDTGLIKSQLEYLIPSTIKRDETEMMDVDAAQAAASEADAILDSLQMPHIEATVPANVTVVPPSSCSEHSSGASVASADESLADNGVTTRAAAAAAVSVKKE